MYIYVYMYIYNTTGSKALPTRTSILYGMCSLSSRLRTTVWGFSKVVVVTALSSKFVSLTALSSKFVGSTPLAVAAPQGWERGGEVVWGRGAAALEEEDKGAEEPAMCAWGVGEVVLVEEKEEEEVVVEEEARSW
jgi:hypothetical protein